MLPLGDADDRLQLLRFKNAEFDKLLDQAGQTDDTAKRNQLLQKADAHPLRGGAGVVLQLQQGRDGLSAVDQGLQANATELTHQYPEYIWVDATSPAK